MIHLNESYTNRSRPRQVATASFTLQTCVGSSAKLHTTHAFSMSSASSAAQGSQRRSPFMEELYLRARSHVDAGVGHSRFCSMPHPG